MILLELPKKFKLKKDAYTRRRGTPKMLFICCSSCNNYIISYQKDGPGPLLRCYLDRIHHPDPLQKLQSTCVHKSECPLLGCDTCKTTIGIPYVYEKENRLAYAMQPGSFILKKKKLL